MTNKYVAFPNANLSDPAGDLIQVKVIQQPDGSFNLATGSSFQSVSIPFTSGSGGAVTVASTTRIDGIMTDVYVNVGASGSSLGVVVKVFQDTGVTETLLTLTNVAASANYRPRYPSCTAAGVANSDTVIMASIHGTFTIEITGAGDTKSGAVHISCL